jgi:hypothetical protein
MKFVRLTILLSLLLVASSASALSLLEIISGGTNDQPQNLADNYASIDDVTSITLVSSSGSGSFGSCIDNTSCSVDLTGLDASFLTVKANGYEALYSVAPGDTVVAIDVSTWDDDLGIPGASGFASKWPNQGGNYPGISNIRAWGPGDPGTPVPEPSAALVFAGGMLIAATRLRRRR